MKTSHNFTKSLKYALATLHIMPALDIMETDLTMEDYRLVKIIQYFYASIVFFLLALSAVSVTFLGEGIVSFIIIAMTMGLFLSPTAYIVAKRLELRYKTR